MCKAYGTTDVLEAVAAEVRGLTKTEIFENTVKELRSMEAKCKKCGNLFTYDGRKVKQTPENCEECGQEKPEDLKGFNPTPIEVPVKRKAVEANPVPAANPLLDAFDAFQADCRKIFIARQNEHAKESILDVTLEDLVGVHRLKGARIKQQIKSGVPFPEVFHDSLIDNSVYCFILWAVHSGEWERLEWCA